MQKLISKTKEAYLAQNFFISIRSNLAQKTLN